MQSRTQPKPRERDYSLVENIIDVATEPPDAGLTYQQHEWSLGSRVLSGDLTGENNMTMNDDRFTEFESRFAQCLQGWKQGKALWSIDSELIASISRWVESRLSPNQEDFARSCLEDLRSLLALLTWWLGLSIKSFTLETAITLEVLGFLTYIVRASLAARHLSAFLKRIGYETAQRVYQEKLRNQRNTGWNLPPYNSVDEVFSFAWEAAMNPAHFFRKFQEQMPSLINYYAIPTMRSIINDKVFAKKYPASTSSPYGLLRKLESRKQKKAALQRQGYWEPMQSCYVLAWECCNQVYTPSRSLGRLRQTEPTQVQWEAIANQYNNLQQQSDTVANQNVDWREIKTWINNICIPAVKNYLSPHLNSIDIGSSEENNAPKELPDDSLLSPDLWLQQEEMNEIIKHFKEEFNLDDWLVANLEVNLDAETKTILLLRHGFKLTQIQAAIALGWYEKNRPAQTKVLRREKKVREMLAREVNKWANTHQPKVKRQRVGKEELVEIEAEIDINFKRRRAREIEEEIVEIVQPKLDNYYEAIVTSFSKEAFRTVDSRSFQILRLRYIERMDEAAIALALQLREIDVKNRLADGLRDIQQSIVNQITLFPVPLQLNEPAAETIDSLVKTLLKTAT